MKQILCFVLALIMVCGSFILTASADGMKAVHCAEQSFTVTIPSDKSAEWVENYGLRISVESPGYVPYIEVWRRTGDDRFKNPTNYLNNVYREYMEDKYNNNVGTNPASYIEIGGKELLGAHYHYVANGNNLIVSVFIEIREDGDVEYLAKYAANNPDETLAVLDDVVRYYTPDGAEPVPQPQPATSAIALEDVICEEQMYTTKMPAGLSYTWQDNGLRIWGETEGYVPNVQIWVRDSKLNDPEKYMYETYTDYMKETYGDRLIGSVQFESYETGGKQLMGVSYIYKGSNSGATINQLHLVEIRDDADVEYNARYLNEEKDATLEILDVAVRYYHPGLEPVPVTPVNTAPAPASSGRKLNPNRSGGTAPAATKEPAPAATQAPTPAPTKAPPTQQLKTAPVKPIVAKTVPYKDGRFYMNLPEGWKIMTQSEFMTFCFKAWDPANPNRTIFFFMKMEPFLKSQAAKDAYKRVNDSLGGQSLYAFSAEAPVMESCTLQGLLDSIPQVYSFCDKFYDSGMTVNPEVLPQMKNVSVIEKKASNLPAPPTCKENVIGRITFDDYLGQKCEGLVTAQPTDSMSYDFFGVDGWPYTVYLFMGVTSPLGEMAELEPVLTECLGSFGFEQNYVKQAIGVSNAETQALLAQAKTMQAAHDAMVEAWYAREKSHDIEFQKWSDAFMGYDRLYDSSTGEVYLADTGFYDSYDLHRYEYTNSNLQLVDSSSQDYYLKGADYYISK